MLALRADSDGLPPRQVSESLPSGSLVPCSPLELGGRRLYGSIVDGPGRGLDAPPRFFCTHSLCGKRSFLAPLRWERC